MDDLYTSAPRPNSYPQEESAPVVSFGDWLATLLIASIPILNIIMLFVWTSENNNNPNKANWAKATLVLIGIQLVFLAFMVGIFLGRIHEVMQQMGV